MFRGFDFGKALLKQVEGFKRLRPQQQRRREAGLMRQLDKYAKKYLDVVTKPGGANPGLLKNGAEALVEAALTLSEGTITYRAFAELVSRSRKVPVVPGLAQLVDKLLEVPTSQREERVALLNWRISTGSLRPERHLEYLSQRARLTAETSHWKDYAWGLMQLLKKESLSPTDDAAIHALEDLLENKLNLGDLAASVQLTMGQAQLALKNPRQSEQLFLELATEAKSLPEEFVDAADRLLDVRPESSWELHQFVLIPAIAAHREGTLGWGSLEEKLSRASRHLERLLDFLLELDALPLSERLAVFVARCLVKLDAGQLPEYLDHWNRVFEHAQTSPPAAATQLLEHAPGDEQAHAELVAEHTEIEGLAAKLAECDDPGKLREVLADAVHPLSLEPGDVALLAAELQGEGLADWAIGEAQRWIASELLDNQELDEAVSAVGSLMIADSALAGEIAGLLRDRVGEDLTHAAAQALIAKLELLAGNCQAAFAAAQALSMEDPQRARLLTNLEEHILGRSEPPPAMLMTLAQIQRDARGDPQGGFEAATTAALLAPKDAEVQATYQTWLEALPAVVIHHYRAKQGTYLCVHESQLEMLPLVLDEIEALAEATKDELRPEPLMWLDELRPLLDEMAEAEQPALRTRWTRLYLMYAVKAGEKERLPEALSTASRLIQPEAALSLVAELGGEVPAEARLMVEYQAQLLQGNWEKALDLVQEAEHAKVLTAAPVRHICESVPAEALLPAAERLTGILGERGDEAAQLELIKGCEARIGDVGAESAGSLRGFLDGLLVELCDRSFEPAIRYRLEVKRSGESPEVRVRDLLALAQEGDVVVLPELKHAFAELLRTAELPDLLTETAEVIARHDAGKNPQGAAELLARAGLALELHEWAIGRIDELGLPSDFPAHRQLSGHLALKEGDFARALSIVEDLAQIGESAAAQELARRLATAELDSEDALLAMIRLSVSKAQIDTGQSVGLRQATTHLLKLARLYHREGKHLADALAPLESEIEAALTGAPELEDAQHLRLALAALAGENERAAELVNRIADRGQSAVDELLALFDRLALEDTDLPSPLVVAWGRALFRAGRAADALDRLAGLRDAVGDYPEYIALLEEIKEENGGPGACMQLGEAYLRVNLWQRSAEEYADALDQDGTLAEPILTQLRHRGALDPNPMKYPLHLVGLRAVVGSSRQADWGWALSAFSWLLPRWSAEELYGLAQQLWSRIDRVELSEEQRLELLLHLFKLATKLGQPAQALEHLGLAWESQESPGPEVIASLGEMDRANLPDDPALWLKFSRYELEAAILRYDLPAVIEAAKHLAEMDPRGRDIAIGLLEKHQEQADDPVPLLLTRLRLLDLQDADERTTFVSELLSAAEADLPADQTRYLVHTVLELLREAAHDPDLVRLLLRLLDQLGDHARAWQLALKYIAGDGEPATSALDILHEVASDEYAVAQQVALIEVHLLRGEYDTAVSLLTQLDREGLDQTTTPDGSPMGARAADMAEALLAAAADEAEAASQAARVWLIDWYREHEREALAADHLVWSHAAGHPLPAEWLHEQDSGELLFRSAQVMEIEGDVRKARAQYAKATEAQTDDPQIKAAIRARLSVLLEQEGRLEQAHAMAEEAADILSGYPAAKRRVADLQRAINLEQITKLRKEDDTPERTLSIARLLRACGDLEQAIEELQGGISRGQSTAELYLELAECFNETADHTIARRAFAEVLEHLSKEKADAELKLRALYGLAEAEEHLQNTGEAVRHLEQIQVMRHNYRDSRQRLKRLYGERRSKPAEPAADARASLVDEILSLLDQPEEEESGSE